MSELDEGRLRAHLRRRRESPDLPDSFAAAIVKRAAGIEQDRPHRRVLHQLRWRLPAIAAVAAAVIFALAVGAGISPPTPSPAATPPALMVLTAEELLRYTERVSAIQWADRVVIVDADLERAALPCPAPGPCASGYVMAAGQNVIVVLDPDPSSAPHLPPEALSFGDSIAGPVAVRLRPDRAVELIGPVQTLLGDGVIWTIESMLVELERIRDLGLALDVGPDGVAVGPPFAVDAWLVEVGIAPSCPAAPRSSPPIIAVFGCGPVAWLTAEAVQPTTVRSGGALTEYDFDTPEGGVRVQNAAYHAFAPDPTRTGLHDLPEPRRALFLVRPILAFPPADCFVCSQTEEAVIVGRIDPIVVPDAPGVSSN